MNLDTAARITRSGLLAHAARVAAHATNIANAETTRTPEGGPFRPLLVALRTTEAGLDGRGVSVVTRPSTAPALGRFDPTHPHADADGWAWYPDLDMNVEVTSLAMARRAYEANLAAADALRSMGRAVMEMLR